MPKSVGLTGAKITLQTQSKWIKWINTTMRFVEHSFWPTTQQFFLNFCSIWFIISNTMYCIIRIYIYINIEGYTRIDKLNTNLIWHAFKPNTRILRTRNKLTPHAVANLTINVYTEHRRKKWTANKHRRLLVYDWNEQRRSSMCEHNQQNYTLKRTI